VRKVTVDLKILELLENKKQEIFNEFLTKIIYFPYFNTYVDVNENRIVVSSRLEVNLIEYVTRMFPMCYYSGFFFKSIASR
jgi:hypothetical protein